MLKYFDFQISAKSFRNKNVSPLKQKFYFNIGEEHDPIGAAGVLIERVGTVDGGHLDHTAPVAYVLGQWLIDRRICPTMTAPIGVELNVGTF